MFRFEINLKYKKEKIFFIIHGADNEGARSVWYKRKNRNDEQGGPPKRERCAHSSIGANNGDGNNNDEKETTKKRKHKNQLAHVDSIHLRWETEGKKRTIGPVDFFQRKKTLTIHMLAVTGPLYY